MKTFLSICLLAISLGLNGCNDTSSTDKQTNFRVFNGVPDVSSLDFFLDAKSYVTNVRYLESSGYSDEEAGSHKVSASISGSFTPLADTSISLADSVDHTFFVFGPSEDPEFLTNSDDNDPPGKDAAKVQLLNAASAHNSIDVYIVPNNHSIADVIPTYESVGYKTMADYVSSAKGTYSIIVTDKDSKDILSTKASVTLEGDSVYTVVITDAGDEGDLPKVTILRDR